MILTTQNRIALLDKDYNFILSSTTKGFIAYFDHLAKNLFDVILPSMKTRLENFLKESDKKRSDVFLLLRNSGEYRYNFVTVENLSQGFQIQIFDIYDAIEFTQNAVSWAGRIRALLGISKEYLFMFRKSDSLFKVVYYNEKIEFTPYKMELGVWRDFVVENGFVPQDQIQNLDKFVEGLRDFPKSLLVKLESGIRTKSSITEKLRFVATRHDFDGETYMVGRIFTDSEFQRSKHSSNLLNELQIDALSGVYNKKMISAYAKQKIESGENGCFALVIVDLDHFKPVNDQYGHLAGDKVIARAAAKIKEAVGDDGVVGRFGGDEFMLILEDVSNVQVLRGYLYSILLQIRHEFAGNFEGLTLSCSVGAARYPINGTTYDELFSKADFCLYRAKDKGRDRYVFFRDDLHAKIYDDFKKAQNAGVKTDGREIQELRYLANFMQKVKTDSLVAFEDIFRHIFGAYALDFIAVYHGKDLARTFFLGIDRDELKDAKFALSDDFKKALNGTDLIRFDFPFDLKDEWGEFKREMDKKNIGSAIICVFSQNEGNVDGIVFFGRTPAKWAEYEVNSAHIVSSTLSLLNVSKIFCSEL